MKLTKRNNYNLKASVHTAEVKSNDVFLVDALKDYIKTVISKDGRQSIRMIGNCLLKVLEYHKLTHVQTTKLNNHI